MKPLRGTACLPVFSIDINALPGNLNPRARIIL
jgi:hypothetical protein